MTQQNAEFWAQTAQQLQQTFSESWAHALESFQGMGGAGASLPGAGPALQFAPDKLQELQAQYLKDATSLWTQGFQGVPIAGDKRFSAESWANNPVAALSAATYLLNSKTLMGLADAVEADAKTRARIRFAVEQLTAASSPSNFLAFNAEAQKKAI